jgi:hypothetical protein
VAGVVRSGLFSITNPETNVIKSVENANSGLDELNKKDLLFL